MTELTFYAVVVVGGKGARLGGEPKQYRKLGGQELWLYATLGLARHEGCLGGVVVCPAGKEAHHRAALNTHEINVQGLDAWQVTAGGAVRQDSVKNGLEALQALPPQKGAAVLIHDGARPFIAGAVVARLLKAYQDGQKAVIPALAPSDSLKQVADSRALTTLPRDNIMRVQTPQCFDFDMIYDLHQRFAGAQLPDDSALVEKLGAEKAGGQVVVVAGDVRGFKITDAADWQMAEQIFATTAETRIGHGYDLHRFADAGKTEARVMLCGVALPHSHEICAHSDGDVGLHALTDAILGAIGAGDIGVHFPPSDATWRDADSKQFVAAACKRLKIMGGRIINCDMTIVAEAPKLDADTRAAMREVLAELLDIDASRINIKATTGEGIGAIGRGEAIAVHAIVSVAAIWERGGL